MKSISTVKVLSLNLTNRIINPKPLTSGFAPIPNWLLCRPEVSFGAKATYARVIQFADKDGVAWPSQETLAKELGIKTRQVKTYIQELVRFSLIVACLTGMPASNSYYFLYHPWMDESAQQDRQSSTPQDGQSSAQQDGQSSAQQDGQSSALNKNKEKNKEKNTHRGQENVCVCKSDSEPSVYSEKQWLQYALAQKNVHNPEGLANSLAKSNKKDHLMEAFLANLEKEKENSAKTALEAQQHRIPPKENIIYILNGILGSNRSLVPWETQYLQDFGHLVGYCGQPLA